jgi:hypothetical protein
MKNATNWKRVDGGDTAVTTVSITDRLLVPGGWIYRIMTDVAVPDPHAATRWVVSTVFVPFASEESMADREAERR